MLQEWGCPPLSTPAELWIGKNARQGVSVFSPSGYAVQLDSDYDPVLRWALPARVEGPIPFQVLALWILRAPEHYVPNLVRILERYREFILRSPTLVLGDFNANPQFDAAHPKYRFQSITDKLRSLGLSSAYHEFTNEGFGLETRPTLYHRYQQDSPFHIDYAFLPDSWVGKIRAVEVGSFDEFRGSSDHRPMTVELDIT